MPRWFQLEDDRFYRVNEDGTMDYWSFAKHAWVPYVGDAPKVVMDAIFSGGELVGDPTEALRNAEP